MPTATCLIKPPRWTSTGRAHQKQSEWTPSRLIQWAAGVGRATSAVAERILVTEPHLEMGFRSCLGILRLAKQCSSERVEAAARRALAFDACSYQTLKSMLERGLDRLPMEFVPPRRPAVQHDKLGGCRPTIWPCIR